MNVYFKKWEYKKLIILVTGGAGFVGSILVPVLLESGYEVTVLDSFMYRQTSLNHLCIDPNLTIIKGDCRDFSIVTPLFRKADIIIPLAALVGAPLCAANQEAALSTNYHAVKKMAAMASADQKFIIPISNSGYGIGEPGKECTEETPMRPISLYGRTKVDAEKACFDCHSDGVISLRLATVFGVSPRMRTDLLVNDFVLRAVTDRCVTLFEPHFKRNYIHVRDVAEAFIHAINRFEIMKGQAFNVGLSNANLSKKELCEVIRRHVSDFVFTEAPIGEDPDKRNYIVSNAKIEATGFHPAYDLDDGIVELKKCYTYLRNNVHGNF